MIDKEINLGVSLMKNTKNNVRVNCNIEKDTVSVGCYSGQNELLLTDNIKDVAILRDFCNEIIKSYEYEKPSKIKCDHNYLYEGDYLGNGSYNKDGWYICSKCGNIKDLV